MRARAFQPAEQPLPWVIEPESNRDPGALAAWVKDHEDEVQGWLTRYGALLFRGFAVNHADDFEVVARAISPDLQRDYLGTSPRNAISSSGYVFSASELPPWYPIPQHNEMSFIAQPPQRVFFSCLLPSPEGGETPIVDMRRVARDLHPAVRERFAERGIRIVRNYAGPGQQGRLDPWKLKRWDEMFATTDRVAAEARARQEGFEVEWDGDRMRLISHQPAFRTHPTTGETVWFNHLQVFHLHAAALEYRRIAALRGDLRGHGLAAFSRLLTGAQASLTPRENLGMHATFLDGQEIPLADLEHVIDTIWRHLVVRRWEQGDILAIDNNTVSHGRLPYRGPRTVAVCWS